MRSGSWIALATATLNGDARRACYLIFDDPDLCPPRERGRRELGRSGDRDGRLATMQDDGAWQRLDVLTAGYDAIRPSAVE